MVKASSQNNKNWASSKCLVRKGEKMYLPQILGMWNSENGTSEKTRKKHISRWLNLKK